MIPATVEAEKNIKNAAVNGRNFNISNARLSSGPTSLNREVEVGPGA